MRTAVEWQAEHAFWRRSRDSTKQDGPKYVENRACCKTSNASVIVGTKCLIHSRMSSMMLKSHYGVNRTCSKDIWYMM